MEIPLAWLLKKNRRRIIGGVFLFWLIIGGMIYLTEELIAANYFGAKALDRIEKMQYLVRWLIWPLLTPLIIFLALKLEFKRTHILRFVLMHIVLGTVVLSVEFVLEIGIIKFFVWKLYQQAIPVRDYTIPFLFKYWAYISIYFLIVGTVNVFVYIHKYQVSQQSLVETDMKNKQLEYDLTLAQLNSLKMQLQPHFLFNTHHAIISLMMQHQNELAIGMLVKLSELLRITIDQSEAPTVTLKEEIAYMKLYLDIQQIRFRDRLRIEIDVPHELESLTLPTFILQPLIENAITHGIAPYSDAGLISIGAARTNNGIRVWVADDGPGIVSAPEKTEGLGIRNTRNRLQQLFGTNGCRLSLTSNSPRGAISLIEIYRYD